MESPARVSAISNPIGQEGLHQGSAKVIFYLGLTLRSLWQISPTPNWYSGFSTAQAAVARWVE